MTDIDPAELLAAAMRPHGMHHLERSTGVPSARLAVQLQRVLDDPESAVKWPREVRVLRDLRESRRRSRSALG